MPPTSALTGPVPTYEPRTDFDDAMHPHPGGGSVLGSIWNDVIDWAGCVQGSLHIHLHWWLPLSCRPC